MYGWSEEGIERHFNRAKDDAFDLMARGLSDGIEADILERMNFFVEASESGFHDLLKHLLPRVKPVRTAVPDRTAIPPREPISDEAVRAAAGPSPTEPKRAAFRTDVPPLTFLDRIVGKKAAHERRVKEAAQQDQARYETAMTEYKRALSRWMETLEVVRARLERERDQAIRRAEEYNARVAAQEAKLASGGIDLLEKPIRDTIEEMLRPKGAMPLGTPLPTSLRVRIDARGRSAIVEAKLPGIDIVPPVDSELRETTFPT